MVQQPYFMPWLGFFRKLACADIYVSLDRATFRRNHIGRTAVLGPQGLPLWLTVPVGGSQNRRIGDISLPRINEYAFHFDKVLSESYSNARGGPEAIAFVRKCLAEFRPDTTLARANLAVIGLVQDLLGLRCRTVEESSLGFQWREARDYQRDRHIVNLVRAVQGSELITGDGSSERVHEFELIERLGISVTKVAAFAGLREYPQWQRERSGLPFLPGLSFVDCLLNAGVEGLREAVLT